MIGAKHPAALRDARFGALLEALFSSPKPPAPAPPPPAPLTDPAQIKQQQDAAAQEQLNQQNAGRASTILTGSQGVGNTSSASKTLLGQ